MRYTLDEIETFLAVMELGSVTAASARLNLSQNNAEFNKSMPRRPGGPAARLLDGSDHVCMPRLDPP